jgi:hypothetical protein
MSLLRAFPQRSTVPAGAFRRTFGNSTGRLSNLGDVTLTEI